LGESLSDMLLLSVIFTVANHTIGFLFSQIEEAWSRPKVSEMDVEKTLLVHQNNIQLIADKMNDLVQMVEDLAEEEDPDE